VLPGAGLAKPEPFVQLRQMRRGVAGTVKLRRDPADGIGLYCSLVRQQIAQLVENLLGRHANFIELSRQVFFELATPRRRFKLVKSVKAVSPRACQALPLRGASALWTVVQDMLIYSVKVLSRSLESFKTGERQMDSSSSAPDGGDPHVDFELQYEIGALLLAEDQAIERRLAELRALAAAPDPTLAADY
jgi:hypothetical protein